MNRKKHSMNFFWRGIIPAVIVSLFFVGACSKKESRVSAGSKGGVLHLGNGAEPQDLDPNIVTGVPENKVMSSLFEGLVAYDPKTLGPVPGVAESWTVSGDQLVYTFKLRKDAKWSNGDMVTAKDFAYSWQRALSPALASEYAYMLYYIKNAQKFNGGDLKDFSQVGVKVQDDHTLVVTLENPTPFFLNIMQFYTTWPVHKATVEAHGKMTDRGTKWTRPENIVTNGAFILKKWELNKVISVEKNPNYWDAKTVKLNAIHFYPIESNQTEERSFRTGDLHVTSTLFPDKIPVYQKDHPELLRIDPYLGVYYYRFNVTKPPLDNKLVRKALAMSIDRDMIVRKVTKGGQLPAASFVPPNTAGYSSANKVPYDVEQAKKLLAEAGYPGGKGIPKIELLFNTSEAHKKIAEAIQQMWKTNLGIEVTLTNQEWKVYLSTMKSLDYQVARSAWIGDYPDPNTFMDMHVKDGGNNRTGFANAEHDRLIAQATRTLDIKKRYEIFQQAEGILLDEVPIAPIYFYTNVFLVSPDVQGWYPTIQDIHPYKHVWLESVE